jgi:ATP-binding cassette subfamily F protein uup
VGYVPQDPRFDDSETVASVLRAAAREETAGDRGIEGRVAVALGKAGFTDGDAAVAALSGGWQKRLAIARELVREPELLLLDEPTNHLDVDGILWLEGLLVREPEAFLAVSHDRYFLEAVAGRVLELNQAFVGGVLDVSGRYHEYLEKKDELLAGQAVYQESLRNRVREEIAWLSRKARARTRKARARVDEARRLQEELDDLDERSRSGRAEIDFASTARKTKRLLVAEGLRKGYGGRSLLDGLDLVLSPGLRLGLLGGNGSGKTTLLRLLSGEETPDAGTVERAPALKVVTFDQHRSRLDPAVSLRRTLAPAGDSVVDRGRAIHVAAWAKRFLFRSEQLETPVGRLSGGEQARVLIACLMLEPADVLLLDEPTNDLDIPTLEVLEESLLEFPGALVLVTHDRYLLDRISTRILALDGRGGATFYADYPQWEQARPRAVARTGRPAPRERSRPESSSAPPRKRLTYRDQREWDQMEARILDAEEHLDTCRRAAEDPAVAADHEVLRERHQALAAAEAAVGTLYARWAELEAKVKG